MDKKLEKALRRCIGMARGIVVLDENLLELENVLERYFNMHVITPEPRMSDHSIAKKLLGGRILITKNSKDFIRLAPIYDFGIIAVENVKFIDPLQSASNITANMLSDIMVDADVWSKRGAFLLTVQNDGKYTIKDLS